MGGKGQRDSQAGCSLQTGSVIMDAVATVRAVSVEGGARAQPGEGGYQKGSREHLKMLACLGRRGEDGLLPGRELAGPEGWGDTQLPRACPSALFLWPREGPADHLSQSTMGQ